MNAKETIAARLYSTWLKSSVTKTYAFPRIQLWSSKLHLAPSMFSSLNMAKPYAKSVCRRCPAPPRRCFAQRTASVFLQPWPTYVRLKVASNLPTS